MRHSIKSTMFVGAFLFGLLMCFTSCEDILGEWSKPTPVTPTTVSVTSITLDQTTLNKKVGDAAVTLNATVSPDNATDKSLTWTSDKPAVATVADGVVTFKGAGTAIITATANDGSGVEATCTVTVTISGLLAGKFTINGDATNNQVQFSQGNLQYTKSTGIWSFMEHQWTTVETNGSVGDDYSSQGVVSLFGWGTSGYNHGATCYLPYSTDNDYAKYSAYGDASKNLYDETGQADWGYNKISNGGDAENSGWRTLTKDEWVWLLGPETSPNPGTNCRTSSTIGGTANARFAKAFLDTNSDGTGDIHGIIIFPDDYTHPTGVADPTGINKTDGTSWSGNKYNAADWSSLESAGCVFLPVAGNRAPSTVYNSTDQGTYWSSTRKDATNAFRVFFSNAKVVPDEQDGTNNGKSVRLVYDVL